MALREEKRRGEEFTYDWIVRARFDVAWVRPLPPLKLFSREAVWFGAYYWYVGVSIWHSATTKQTLSCLLFG